MRWLRDFAGSMGGRIFAIVAIGVVLTAILATTLADWRRRHDFAQLNLTRAGERVAGFVAMVEGADGPIRETMLAMGGQGIWVRRDEAKAGGTPPAVIGADTQFDAIARELGLTLAASRLMAPEGCLPGGLRRRMDAWQRQRVDAGLPEDDPGIGPEPGMEPPVCRWVDVTLADGRVLKLSVSTPPVLREPTHTFDPWFLALLVAGLAALAYVVSRMAAAPLLRLARTASELGHDLDRSPMPESGPTEVGHAAKAFNAMQARLQATLRERTHMLAAITHDLQTPLTRLRLRLEKVEDETLRERLVADLGAMQALIREGLDLARSADAAEARVPLDLDSLLESLVDDAADAGADIRLEQRCHSVLTLRPLAMHRVFANLVDNALKYGGSAVVRAWRERGDVVVAVTNPGAPIPEDRIDGMFEPFVRLETSRSRDTGGIGLGLTIANTLAQREGATLTLRNVAGGVEATVRWQDVAH